MVKVKITQFIFLIKILSFQVKKLNISYNEISIFPPSINRFYNLNALDIRGNRLTELPANALQNLTTLEVLNLSKNYFETWLNLNPNEVFEPATHLKTLDLSHNKFKTMGNLANQELLISSSLEILILDHCQIDSIHGRSPLSGLINIRILSLNHNPLQRIHSLISPTLNSLFVNNCELSNINRNELTYLPSLVYLQMSHNYRLELSSSTYNLYSESLKFLDISYCNVLQPNLQGFPNLRKAVLNHNMVRFLGSNEFANNTKLEYLDLSYNNIGSLRSDTFRGLSKLKYLDLSWNEIAVMPEDSLLQMPSLTNLKLARNYLTRVGHLKSMSITVLDISSCEISAIGKDSLEGLQSLVDLDLSRNLLSYIPESISSNTLRYLNLNYNRISTVNNFTFFMLPRLTGLAVIGNRFTTIWKRSFFDSNVYLERLDLGDNMWRCDCADDGMFDFYDFITLEPNKKEESYNLICNSPANVIGQTWLEACYFIWNPSEKNPNIDSLIWFIIVMIITLSLCILLVNTIRRSMKRRLRNIQAERERQVEEARDRLRQLRIRAEQEALCNTPDPRDLIAPPSYDEALSMPKLNTSCHSLNETGTGKTRRKRGRRKTKSSGDLLEETERNGNVRTYDDMELAEPSGVDRQRRPRRNRRYGSHEIAELDTSPGARRRQIISEYVDDNVDSIVVEVEAELERPSRRTERSISTDDNLRHESDF
ncbi:hypothetical protein O3G_MSEX004951 [Manduca sexta]|uniref:Insulin-like growth factor-binding protein complex acid labile subunit n=1 Tax=Manduca sexta TaxID=7130 RepID=A0A921YZ31_MANSE|nr:hypothetical protein O3G_MSEX004951 [Manduca sexta]